MTLFYAHYPSLEQSFVRFVRQHRRALEPWLVVCASSFMAHRLSEVLAREQGAVGNIHFCTVSALLSRLDNEQGVALPVFPQDHLRDFLLKDILTEPGLNLYPVSQGLVGALKSALRDLADSLAGPEVLEEQLQACSAMQDFSPDQEKFAWLVRVYKRYAQREAQIKGYRSYQQFFERALEQVEESDYLKQFDQLVWYGFYDMSGRQLELQSRLRTHYALTVFAPYSKVPAYQFAQKFFETNWLGLPGEVTDENTDSFGALGKSGGCFFSADKTARTEGVQIVSAADTSGEVFFAAKEILRLVEEKNYAFSDIAVLARTTGSYQHIVRRVFAQNKIPLRASFTYPLQQVALGVFCLNLLTLDMNGLSRQDVLAVLSSPYFKSAQKRAWRKLADKSLVSLNLTQWQDLLPQTEGFDPAFLTWLEHLHARLSDLSTPGPWKEKCQQARHLLAENIDEAHLQDSERAVYERICTCIDSLAQYEVVRAQSRAGEFIRELIEALSSLQFHEVESAADGVHFADVLRTRGLSFKVVFLLGVNEKIFPQIVPEDPVFRDKYRYILRDMLGYWVNQKAERTQEERLLFFTACSSAVEKLYVSYACRGEDNKEITPSVYVAELARATEQPWSATEKPRIPAHWASQLAGVNPLFLTPQEMTCVLMLHGKDVAENLHAAGLDTPSTSRQLAFARAMKSPICGPYDGYVQNTRAAFHAVQTRGISASSLQDLAACPMRYFFRKVLHLADREDVFTRDGLAPNKKGTIYHRVLEDFYRELARLKLTHQLFDSAVEEYINRALEKQYTSQSYRLFGIYPVVWELILAQIRAQLVAFAQADIKELGSFIPTYFEQPFEALTLARVAFKLRGIIDRIDVDETGKTFRVADYKSSRKGATDLAKTFFTQLVFQPVLYNWAAEQLAPLKDFTPAGSCLLSIQNGYYRREWPQTELEAVRPRVEKFLQLLAQIIRQGQFVLNPSELCSYCPYGAICRKDNFSCLMRARKSTTTKQLEEARYAD